jgi:hypothetical protein
MSHLSLSIQPGDTFGRWTVTGPLVREKRGVGRLANYLVRYPCRCTCGTIRTVRAFKLLSNSRSCGCLELEQKRARAKHGHNRTGERTRLYRVWDGMMQRCTNASHDSFKRYGGRGVTIHDEWHDFSTFANWALSHGYNDALQLDRINNDAGYSPDNCRFVSEPTNKRNTSVNRYVSAFGHRLCVTDWALRPECHVTPGTIVRRINTLGWTPERAISEPRRSKKASPRFLGNHVTTHP